MKGQEKQLLKAYLKTVVLKPKTYDNWRRFYGLLWVAFFVIGVLPLVPVIVFGSSEAANRVPLLVRDLFLPTFLFLSGLLLAVRGSFGFIQVRDEVKERFFEAVAEGSHKSTGKTQGSIGQGMFLGFLHVVVAGLLWYFSLRLYYVQLTM